MMFAGLLPMRNQKFAIKTKRKGERDSYEHNIYVQEIAFNNNFLCPPRKIT